LSGPQQGVTQQHQPVVAEIDLGAKHETGHAEHAPCDSVLDRRGQTGRGLVLPESLAERSFIEPDLLREDRTGPIIQRRGAFDEERLEQASAEWLDRTEPRRRGAGERQAARLERDCLGLA
jgi:hypothetical protein